MFTIFNLQNIPSFVTCLHFWRSLFWTVSFKYFSNIASLMIKRIWRHTIFTNKLILKVLTAKSSSQTWKHTKNLNNLNLVYVSRTILFLAFTKEITGKMKKFTLIGKNLQKHGLQVCMFFQVCTIQIVLAGTRASFLLRHRHLLMKAIFWLLP